MFTGLVQALGHIRHVDHSGEGARLRVETPLARELSEGDSVAVNGVCLTAGEVSRDWFAAEVMNETLAHTSLGELASGDGVNLELALRAGDRLGGHLVQGHIDGIGIVTAISDDGFARVIEIEASADLLRYVVRKGSIAVDGVSLTVADVDATSFTVSVIPQTLRRTNLAQAQAGARVNLEVDVLAKYVEKLMGARV
jgi:riboflavin synthase